jgi:hypothetical protein
LSDIVDVPDAFFQLAELAFAVGAAPMNQYPGCWEHDVDENWHVSVNAHKEEKAGGPDPRIDVPPFHAAIFWRGWFAGLLSPYGGVLAAHPDGANEERFIKDVMAAQERARASS